MESQRVYGIENEIKIISYLNKKVYKDLNEKWKKHVKVIFPNIEDETVILAKHYPDNCSKPDMILEVNDEEKFISIKIGKCPSVHKESFSSFRRFLERMHVSYKTLEIIRLYHYGDSKKFVTVDHPLSGEELREKFGPQFLQASMELNNDILIRAVISRTVIRGTRSTQRSIDYLYYGDLEHGHLLSVKDIYSIVLSNKTFGKTPIHFGDLVYLPNCRKEESYERNYVRIKWPILSFLYYANDKDIEKMKNGTFTKLSE